MSRPPGLPPVARQRVYLKTAAMKNRALKQYDDLKRSGAVRKAIVVAELNDGSFQVLGQMLKPFEMAPLLVVAAEALAQADAERMIVRLEVHEEPAIRGKRNEQPPRRPEIIHKSDGSMDPPRGENFISCGECNHPRWYVLHYDVMDSLSRYACAHCGNEVKLIRSSEVGTA